MCTFGGEFPCGVKWGYIEKKEFSLKLTFKEALQNLLISCLSFGWALEDYNEEKMGRQYKEEIL